MRILAFGNCPLDRFLGSGKTRLMWSEGLRRYGHTVDVLEPKDFVYSPRVHRAKQLRTAIGAWNYLKKLSLEDYDLIEFYGDQFWLATWRLSRRASRPFLVAHTDGLELLAAERSKAYAPPQAGIKHFSHLLAEIPYSRMSESAFRYADAFVTGCNLDRDYVLQHHLFSPERAEVVPPGLDDEYLCTSYRHDRNDTIIYVGSWVDRKGIDVLSRVMTKVLRSRASTVFEVMGVGGATGSVMAAFPPDIHARIVVHGRLSNQDIAQKLSAAKVFFFPSRYEGFGMALSEAMACGCAVVTTPTGFGAELKQDSEAIVCEFDDERAMEKAIISLLENDGLRQKVALGGRERVQQLQWEANTRKLEQVYLRWLSETSSRDHTA